MRYGKAYTVCHRIAKKWAFSHLSPLERTVSNGHLLATYFVQMTTRKQQIKDVAALSRAAEVRVMMNIDSIVNQWDFTNDVYTELQRSLELAAWNIALSLDDIRAGRA